MKLGHHAVNRI